MTNQQIAFTLQLKMTEAFQAFLKQVKKLVQYKFFLIKMHLFVVVSSVTTLQKSNPVKKITAGYIMSCKQVNMKLVMQSFYSLVN